MDYIEFYGVPDSLKIGRSVRFFPTENRALPSFSIYALGALREFAPNPDPGVYPNVESGEVNIYLDLELLDDETMRQAIANHLGVQAEQIEFV